MKRELARRLLWFTAATLLVLHSAPLQAAAGDPPRQSDRAEAAARLAKVVRLFSQSVVWPEGSLPADHTMRFGVYGADALSVAVARELAAGASKEETTRSDKPNDLKQCQVVFAYNPTQGQLDDLMASTAGRPVLTILFSDDRFAQGAMIELFNTASGLRFFVNDGPFRQAGFSPTPGLLKNMLKRRPR